MTLQTGKLVTPLFSSNRGLIKIVGGRGGYGAKSLRFQWAVFYFLGESERGGIGEKPVLARGAAVLQGRLCINGCNAQLP